MNNGVVRRDSPTLFSANRWGKQFPEPCWDKLPLARAVINIRPRTRRPIAGTPDASHPLRFNIIFDSWLLQGPFPARDIQLNHSLVGTCGGLNVAQFSAWWRDRVHWCAVVRVLIVFNEITRYLKPHYNVHDMVRDPLAHAYTLRILAMATSDATRILDPWILNRDEKSDLRVMEKSCGQWVDLINSAFKKKPVFFCLNSAADPEHRFNVSAWLSVVIQNPQFNWLHHSSTWQSRQ
jgi:hypothetical protein